MDSWVKSGSDNKQTVSLSDKPHTLLSECHGVEIPNKGESSVNRSGSLMSNSLQISNSPTIAYLTEKGYCNQIGSKEMNNKTISNLSQQITKSAPICQGINKSIKDRRQENIYPVSKKITETSVLISGDENKQTKQKPHDLPEKEKNHIQLPIQESKSPKLSEEQAQQLGDLNENNLPCGSNKFSPVSVSHCMNFPPEFPIPNNMEFFHFVILHVRDDIEIARKVCDVLQSNGTGKGTTFCEGFERPGSHPLTCIQDAVENSAYIILLMTEKFESRWAEFQSNTVLMNSITDVRKAGTVIPFLPKSGRLPPNKMPLGLQSLIPLDEMSPVFKYTLQNTFRPDVIQVHENNWRKLQMQKFKKAHHNQDLPYVQLCAKTQSINIDSQPFMSFQENQVPISGAVIQISHADNVQIGNQNRITVRDVASDEYGQYRQSYNGEKDIHSKEDLDNEYYLQEQRE